MRKQPKKPSQKAKGRAAKATPAMAPSRPRKPRAGDAAARAKPRVKSRPVSSRLPVVRTAAYSRDDRETLAILFMPFVMIAMAIGLGQSLRHAPSAGETVALRAAAEARTAQARRAAIASHPRIDISALTSESPRISPEGHARQIPPAEPAPLLVAAPALELPVRDGPDLAASLGRCEVPAALPVLAGAAYPSAPDPETFGRRLAAAAEAQTDDFVVYTDKYRTISYPMGDLPAFYGVCTDVVVRAYRALGLDLQVLVQAAKLGKGDPSIDHRRTEVLRRFFAAYGQSLPLTPFAENYRPGDIVTYHRPENRGAQSHIAIVSDVIAPSGRPMIVHNRGWGPQLEDGLFADRMTGHYRYTGERRPETHAKINASAWKQRQQDAAIRTVDAGASRP